MPKGVEHIREGAIRMHAVTAEACEPTMPVLELLYPGSDVAQVGTWCIMPLSCGITAGRRSRSWRSVAFEGLQVDGFADWLRLEIHQTPNLADLSCGLADLLEESPSLATARETAARRLESLHLGRDRTAGEAYIAMRLFLNSLSTDEPEFYAAAMRWANDEHLGWHRLFFAAGLLVASSKSDYWNKLGTGCLVFLNSDQRAKVRELWNSYADAR